MQSIGEPIPASAIVNTLEGRAPSPHHRLPRHRAPSLHPRRTGGGIAERRPASRDLRRGLSSA